MVGGRSERREQVEDNVWDGGVPTNNLLSISTKGQLSRWNHEGVCHSGDLCYVNITCKYVMICQNRTGYRSGSGTLWHIFRYGALGQIRQHRSDSGPVWYMFIDGCMQLIIIRIARYDMIYFILGDIMMSVFGSSQKRIDTSVVHPASVTKTQHYSIWKKIIARSCKSRSI